MRVFRFLLLCFLALRLLTAQSARSADRVSGPSGLEHEMFLRTAGDGDLQARADQASRNEIEYRRRLFDGKAMRFVTLWTKLTNQISARQTFDVKLAKQVSDAFHDLEKSDGWPVRAGR